MPTKCRLFSFNVFLYLGVGSPAHGDPDERQQQVQLQIVYMSLHSSS